MVLSLTVEVNRAKGPNPAQDRDPIFERGSTTTYSSFRKGTYSKPWSSEGCTAVENKYRYLNCAHLFYFFCSYCVFHIMIVCCLTSETDMFFLAISMVGTDFTMICQLFPHRARSEIKVRYNNRCMPIVKQHTTSLKCNMFEFLYFRTNSKKKNEKMPGGLTKPLVSMKINTVLINYWSVCNPCVHFLLLVL